MGLYLKYSIRYLSHYILDIYHTSREIYLFSLGTNLFQFVQRCSLQCGGITWSRLYAPRQVPSPVICMTFTDFKSVFESPTLTLRGGGNSASAIGETWTWDLQVRVGVFNHSDRLMANPILKLETLFSFTEWFFSEKLVLPN